MEWRIGTARRILHLLGRRYRYQARMCLVVHCVVSSSATSFIGKYARSIRDCQYTVSLMGLGPALLT